MPCRGDTTSRRNPDVRSNALNGIAFANVAGQPLTAKVWTVEFNIVQAGLWVVALEAIDAPVAPFCALTGASIETAKPCLFEFDHNG